MSMYRQAGQKQALSIKDLIITGVFSALFFMFMMIGAAFFAPNPVLTFLMPAGAALLTGPIYLLMIAKVPRFGPILILGIILAMITFVTGMYWLWSLTCVLLAVIGELIASIGKYKSMNANVISYIIFSLHPMGSYIMLWFNQQAYREYLVGQGTEQAYMDTMLSTAQSWMLPAMIVGTMLCAWISALLGKRLLRKQFEKSGVLAD
ncbi:MptD family putative ECF transporter S component [Paenibacillus sp. N3/727]|uniref:MptD family putative ECF transporter S component n=1 Tax=Paenibacillus sp. N3/727 TaxID=2925845 RepID=UPI001F535875|nr:MptD family putative ECF transporter S component [Paenibacillus sp. N3/727]UNK17240.1 MptD family putative ECF transporter S component [Paenibacillus sp. N3/727]